MKFWKNLAVCSALALSCIAFNGCNCSRNHQEISVDLDGDGVISDWETIFDKVEAPNRIISVNNIKEISSFAELKAINDNVSDVNYYKLTKNIDCGGEELNINLGNSVLYCNNKVIKNFKLKEIGFTVGEGEDATHIDANVYGLIYNGVGIYDLRLFMGYQKIEINNLNSSTFISPLVNVGTVDNLVIKGKLDINRIKTDGLSGDNRVDISMCMTNLTDIGEMVSENGYYSPNISNVETIGQINYTEEMTNARVRIGSIISHLTDNAMVYGAKSSVDIEAYSTGTLSVGGIVADNEDFVSTCDYTGTISTTYDPNSNNYIGGIVGRNFYDAEIKNCTNSGNITFNTDVVTSAKPKMQVGGIVGRNLGIVDYVENNGSIDIKSAYDLEIGGICGSSEYGIFSNLINRAKITLTNCPSVYIAEITGISKYGTYEKIIDMSNITINNGTITSTVRLGMITIFEDLSTSATDLVYNAEYTPTFAGVLMTGSVVVNQKKTSDDNKYFVYNLGLRNPYEYVVIDPDTGLPKTEVRTDGNGNPILDEEGQEIIDIIKDTQTPDQYDKLFYLADSYSIKKFNILGEDKAPVQEVLTFTYAKNSSKSDTVTSVSAPRLKLLFFVEDLGFKYGVNHGEIDLGIINSEIDIDKITFTLSVDKSLEKFFEDKKSNGELAMYDSYFDEELKYDGNLDNSKDRQSEMYSFLNALLLSNTSKMYKPLKVSYKFASCQENVDTSIKLENIFARNLKYLIGLIVGAEPELKELASNKEDLTGSSEDVTIKYEYLMASDETYRYCFTFNVTQIVNDNASDNPMTNYIIYLQYNKDNVW